MADHQNIPQELAEMTEGCIWERVQPLPLNEVYRVIWKNRTCSYLKIAPLKAGGVLRGEFDRLKWIGSRLSIPVPEYYICDAKQEYLLLSEVTGQRGDLAAQEQDVACFIEAAVRVLRIVHQIPTKDCPFDHRVTTEIHRAQRDVMDVLACDSREASSVVHRLLKDSPQREDVVFTHGDFRLPNLFAHTGEVTGIIDWSRAGKADRYRDLAALSESVAYYLGEIWGERVFELYGLEEVDWSKVEFFRGLHWIGIRCLKERKALRVT